MTRLSVSLIAIAACLLVATLFAPVTIFLGFAGILLAVFFRVCGEIVAGALRVEPAIGVVIFLLTLVGLAITGSIAVASHISDQLDLISRALPEGWQSLRDNIGSYAWGKRLLNSEIPPGIRWPVARSMTTGVLTSTFGAAGNIVVIFFIGVYGALDPQSYRHGLRLLIGPTGRPAADEVISKSMETLRNWLIGQLMAMLVVGLLTGIGLWLVGIPLALLLGLIAGFLAFIPTIGPIISAVPGVLLAIPEGRDQILSVLAVYIGVQSLESYLITPLIQKRRVRLQPALIITAQVFMGTLFGMLGLALATPMAALAMTLTGELYVKRYLEGGG